MSLLISLATVALGLYIVTWFVGFALAVFCSAMFVKNTRPAKEKVQDVK